MTREDHARVAVEAMMRVDPDTVEVVAAMRSIGRHWLKVYGCFHRHMIALGIDDELPRDPADT